MSNRGTGNRPTNRDVSNPKEAPLAKQERVQVAAEVVTNKFHEAKKLYDSDKQVLGDAARLQDQCVHRRGSEGSGNGRKSI